MKFPLYAQFETSRKIMGGSYVRMQDRAFTPSACWSPIVLLEDGLFYFKGDDPTELNDVHNSAVEEVRVYS